MTIEGNGLLMTLRQAARELAISERKLWQLAKDGDVPVVRIGRSVRFSRAALAAWIAEKSAAK